MRAVGLAKAKLARTAVIAMVNEVCMFAIWCFWKWWKGDLVVWLVDRLD